MRGRRREGPPPGRVGDVESQKKRAFASTVRSLARQPRTAAELETLLERREYSREVIDHTLGRLRELRYVDEVAVADVVVRDAERRKLGSRRVARTLSRRGVPADVAAPALDVSGQGDLERARALLGRRYPDGLDDDPRSKSKALRLLVGRGFPHGIARQAIGLDVDVGI